MSIFAKKSQTNGDTVQKAQFSPTSSVMMHFGGQTNQEREVVPDQDDPNRKEIEKLHEEINILQSMSKPPTNNDTSVQSGGAGQAVQSAGKRRGRKPGPAKATKVSKKGSKKTRGRKAARASHKVKSKKGSRKGSKKASKRPSRHLSRKAKSKSKSKTKKRRTMKREDPLAKYREFVAYIQKDMGLKGGPPTIAFANHFRKLAKKNNPNASQDELNTIAKKIYADEKKAGTVGKIYDKVVKDIEDKKAAKKAAKKAMRAT